jgi:allophanate hydrolase
VDTFQALYEVRALRAQAAEIFARAEFLVVPTTPTIYRIAEVEAQPYDLNVRLGLYTHFVNLLDWCALAIPGGSYANGIPIGITLVGPAFSEATLLAFARRLTVSRTAS